MHIDYASHIHRDQEGVPGNQVSRPRSIKIFESRRRASQLITLLSEETSIIDVGRNPALELTWKVNSRFGVAAVEVYLDSSMYAIPADYQEGVSVEFTYGIPSLSLAQVDPVVSDNRKAVKFKVHNVSLHLNAKGSVQRKRIPFEWVNPSRVPEKVEIVVVARSLLSKIHKETLIGYNATTSIVKFLTHRNDSSFYFPKQSPVYSIPYWVFSKDAALYQSQPNTTVQSITWPNELAYWLSPEGEQYLISQVRKIDARSPLTAPTRIAICPYESSAPITVRTLFMREMEAHSRLGVRVSVITPEALSKIISDKNSIALYGNGLGLDFEGTDSELSEGFLSLMLDSRRIRELGQKYAAINRLSTCWSEYKNRKVISFSDEDSGIWIFNRLRRLRTKLNSTHLRLSGTFRS